MAGWELSIGYQSKLRQEKKFQGNTSILLTQQELLKYGNFKEHGNFVQVNGIKLYYETYGEGEPLLMLHGNNGSIASMRHQIDELKKHYKVIAVDSRGQGHSTNNKKRINYQMMAADMNELLNTLKLDSVNILGWSDGGNTGLVMAMDYPQKVKTLAIMGANLYPDKNATDKKFLREYKLSLLMAQLMARFNPSKWRTKIIVGKMALKEPNIDPSELSNISCPVLVMAGEKDLVNESHTRLIAASISRSSLLILKNLSHFAPEEDPNLFNSSVEAFFRSKAKAGSSARH